MAIDLAKSAAAPFSYPAISAGEKAHSAVCDAFNSVALALAELKGNTPSSRFEFLQNEVTAELIAVKSKLDAIAWKSDAISTDAMSNAINSERLNFRDSDGNLVQGRIEPDGKGGILIKSDTYGWGGVTIGMGKDEDSAIANARWYVALKFEIVPLKG